MLALRRHYLSTLAANTAILLLGTASGILAARLLGPVGRGELAVITLWPMGLAMLGSLGMNQAITFFAAQQPTRRHALFTALLSVAVVQTLLVLAVGYFLLPRLLAQHQPLILQLARLFLLYIPLAFFSGYLLNLLQGSMHLGAYNFSRVFVAAWYAVLLTALFLLGRFSLSVIIVGQLAGYAAVGLLNACLVHRRLHPRLDWDSSIFKPLLSYGAKTHLGSVTAYLNLRLDQLVMSVWLSPEELGFYVVAVTVASALTILPNAVGIVTLPAAAGQSPDRARAVIRQSFRTVVLLLTSGVVLLYLLIPYVLPLLFGNDFVPATMACRVLAWAMIPLGLARVLSESLRALNRPMAPTYAELVGIGVTAILLYALVPRYGFLGAAYASLGAYTSSFLLLLWYSSRRAGLTLRELWQAGSAEATLPSNISVGPSQ